MAPLALAGHIQKVSESKEKQVVLRPAAVADSGSAGGLGAGRSRDFCNCTLFVRADGSGDGHVAFQSFTGEGYFITLKGRHYNQAHGGRRLTHVKETQDVVNTFFCDETSITSPIQHCDELQQWMASNAKSTETYIRISALAYELKKLRHDSCQLFFWKARFTSRNCTEDCDPNHDSAARKTRSSVRSVLVLVHWWRSESKAVLAAGCVR